MPLHNDAINEILPFAPDGVEGAGDLTNLADYLGSTLRLRGHQPGIAERGIQNRANRQSAHMAAGSAQFLANRHSTGILDDGDLDKVEEAWRFVIQAMVDAGTIAAGEDGQFLTSVAGELVWKKLPSQFILGEFYYLRNPTLKPGFQPAQGGLLEDAVSRYPAIWQYLQTFEGQILCKSEEEWQAMTMATWHTLADGTKIGWDGIGGAPFYVVDLNNGTLRLPDLRGMYAEAAGFDSLGVGGVHGDAVRNIVGAMSDVMCHNSNSAGGSWSGAFVQSYASNPLQALNSASNIKAFNASFSAAAVVPTTAKNQPRAWGSLACVYLGLPS